MKGDTADRIGEYFDKYEDRIKEMESKIRSSTFIEELLHAKDRKTRKFIIDWIAEGFSEAKDHPDAFMIWLKEALLGLYKIESRNITDEAELERMKENIKEIIGFEV